MKPTFRVQEVDSSPRSQISAMSPLSTMTALTPISPFTFIYIPSFPQFQGFSVLAEVETKKADEIKSSVVRCGCSKTKCLKLYCECFASGKVCGEECECKECRNMEQFKEEREEIIQKTKHKNPGAFRVDISNNYKICHCTKSNCMKKYCECYQNGRSCNSNCKCKQCKNLPTNDQSE